MVTKAELKQGTSIIEKLNTIRIQGAQLASMDKALRAEFAELFDYAEDATKSASFHIGKQTIALSRSVTRKVDVKALKELMKEYPGIEKAFKPTYKVIAKKLACAGKKYTPLIESVLTDTPGSLALKITDRKDDDEDE